MSPTLRAGAIALQRAAGNRATTLAVERQLDQTTPAQDPTSTVAHPAPRLITFRHNGVLHQLTNDDFQLLLHHIALSLRDDLLAAAVRSFSNVVDVYNDHVRIYNDQKIIGFILETTSGAALPSKQIAAARESLNASRELAGAVDRPTRRSILATTQSLRDTERQINLVDRRLTQYRNDIVGSGETAVFALRITSTACFTIAAVAGGAWLAAPVAAGGFAMGVASSGAIMGGSTALVAEAATTGGRYLVGENLVAGDAGRVLLAGVSGAAGGAAGGAIANKFAGPLAGKLAPRLGPLFSKVAPEVLEMTITDVLAGSMSSAVQGMIQDAATSAYDGNWDSEIFLEHLATNLIAGGIAGHVATQLPVR